MIKRILGLKRYFIFCYTYSVNNGKITGDGTMEVSNNGGEFPSKSWLYNQAKISCGFDNAIIITTNIIEVKSKSDFKNYIGSETKNI